MDLGRIYNLDCVRGLSKLAEGSVDLAFADPPFNIGYDYDVYDDRREGDEYIGWSRKWIQGVVRALKPNGTFWLAIGDEYAAELKVLCTRELGLHCRSWVIWFYTFGVHCTQKFTRSHAHLLCFVKDPQNFTFNSLAIRVPSARELVYGDKRADPNGRVPDDTWLMTPLLPAEVPTKDGFVLRPQDIPERFPPHSDTWYFSRVAGTFAERRGWHGCQMPEQLLGRIIRACSHERDVVLDPFGGSGTTFAVAKKLNRQFIGFELSSDYAKKIEERLSSIRPGEPLTGPENAAMSAPRTNAGRRLKSPATPAAEAVSYSPVVVRANVSLGQVAVANGELGTAVAEAFIAAHDGYSADRVVADPTLNDRFLENCRLLAIPGGPKNWNHLLLNLRKRGGLAAIDTSRRTAIPRAQMNTFIFASEMAWRKLNRERGCALDEILCDPDLASEFDRVARRIAPGRSSFEYRWAALALRKDQAQLKALAHETKGDLTRHSLRISELGRLPSDPGHYLVMISHDPFYVGYSDSLRDCGLLKYDRLLVAADLLGQAVSSEKKVRVRSHCFANAAADSRPSSSEAAQGKWRMVHLANLLRRFEPIANVPLTTGR